MIERKCLLSLAVISVVFLCAKGETEAGSPLKVVCYRQALYYGNGASNNENCSYVVLQVGSLNSKYGLVTQYYNLAFLSEYKKKYPYIKLILGIDPFDHRPSGYPKVITSKVGRSRVVSSAVSAMKDNGYDGIDLIFREKYVRETAQVLSGIRKATGRDGATVSGYFVGNVTRDDFHDADLAEIAKDLDFMTMECYESSKSKPYTQLVAPLYTNGGNSVVGNKGAICFQTSECIKSYLDMGAPRSKVLMAIQNYAVSHTLDDADKINPGSPAQNKGWGQYPAKRDGFLYLYQVTGADWESFRDEKSNSPYSVNYLQWASYDDEISVSDKAKFIKEEGLGGAALTTYPRIDKTDSDLPLAKCVDELLSS